MNRKKRALLMVGSAGFIGATAFALLIPSLVPQTPWYFVAVCYTLTLCMIAAALFTANRIF